MIQSMLIDWLGEGEVPMYDLPPPTSPDARMRQHIRIDSTGHVSVMYTPVHIPRLMVAIDMAVVVEELPRLVQTLLEEAARLGISGTLIFPTRPATVIEGQRYIVCGLSILEGADAVGNAEPVDPHEDVVQLVTTWVNGVEGVVMDDMHAAIRGAMFHHMRRREYYTEMRLKEEASRERALILLRGCLTPEQCAELDEHKWFHVECQGQRYRITTSHAYNVRQINEQGEAVTAFCVVTQCYVPVYDQMLAQKLMLDTNPDRFFEIANRQVLHAGIG